MLPKRLGSTANTLASHTLLVCGSVQVPPKHIYLPELNAVQINLAMKASLIIAVLSVIRFYLALKTHLASHKPLAKLLAFKLVVFFTFILSVSLCLRNVKDS
jgi:hypothetical protein